MSRRSKRVAIAAIAAVAALAALVMWWQSRPDRAGRSASRPTIIERGKRIQMPSGTARSRPALDPRRDRAPVRLLPARVSTDGSAASGLFTGQVVSWGSGKGIEDAEIVFAAEQGATSVRSGSDGRFRYVPPRPGRFRIAVVTAAGYLPYAPRWGHSPIEVHARPRQRVDGLIIYLTPAITYRGRVVDARGQPVPGATIELLGAATGERALAPLRDQFVADGEGEFSFVAPDGAVLEARGPDGQVGRAPVDGSVQITHELVIRLGVAKALARAHDAEKAEGDASVTGRVISASGAPVASFTVAVMRKRGLAENVVKYTSIFDAEGRFTVSGLAPGTYWLRAMGYGFAPSSGVSAEATEGGGSPVTITLPEGGALFGRVVSAGSGQPLESARVSVEGSFGSGSSALPSISSAVTGSGGEFELSGLGSGNASVIASAYKHNSRVLSRIAVTPGARIGPVTIELTPVKAGEEPRLELAGLGVALRADGDGLVIQKLFPGSGAAEAGLVAGDTIVAVDGRAVIELGFSAAIQAIRGPVGSTVRLRVRRASGEEAEIVATRRKVSA